MKSIYQSKPTAALRQRVDVSFNPNKRQQIIDEFEEDPVIQQTTKPRVNDTRNILQKSSTVAKSLNIP